MWPAYPYTNPDVFDHHRREGVLRIVVPTGRTLKLKCEAQPAADPRIGLAAIACAVDHCGCW